MRGEAGDGRHEGRGRGRGSRGVVETRDSHRTALVLSVDVDVQSLAQGPLLLPSSWCAPWCKCVCVVLWSVGLTCLLPGGMSAAGSRHAAGVPIMVVSAGRSAGECARLGGRGDMLHRYGAMNVNECDDLSNNQPA